MVVQQVGQIGIRGADATKLYDLTRAALDREESVLLDFADVKPVTPSFLMGAIGSLFEHFSEKDLDARLICAGLHPVAEAILPDVKRKALLFFSAPPEVQEELIRAEFRRCEEG